VLCLRHAGASINLTEARFEQPKDLLWCNQHTNILKKYVQLSYLRAARSSEFAVNVAQSAKTSIPSGSEDSQFSQLLIAQARFFLAEDARMDSHALHAAYTFDVRPARYIPVHLS
jgi:hypothetical protein